MRRQASWVSLASRLRWDYANGGIQQLMGKHKEGRGGISSVTHWQGKKQQQQTEMGKKKSTQMFKKSYFYCKGGQALEQVAQKDGIWLWILQREISSRASHSSWPCCMQEGLAGWHPGLFQPQLFNVSVTSLFSQGEVGEKPFKVVSV